MISGDTFSTPFDFGAQGSRTAFAVGNACRAAVADLKRQIVALTAKHLGVEESAVQVGGGAATAEGKRATLAELARLSQASGGGLIAH